MLGNCCAPKDTVGPLRIGTIGEVAHPGDSWPQLCPRRLDKPTLIIEGRRSIYTAWPPGAVCEMCGIPLPEGYVGPVDDDVVRYPAPETRFICEACARSMVGLGTDGLTGHACRPSCTDELHEDLVYLPEDQLAEMEESERIEHFCVDYAERGWRVIYVSDSPSTPRVDGGRTWSVWFVPVRNAS